MKKERDWIREKKAEIEKETADEIFKKCYMNQFPEFTRKPDPTPRPSIGEQRKYS